MSRRYLLFLNPFSFFFVGFILFAPLSGLGQAPEIPSETETVLESGEGQNPGSPRVDAKNLSSSQPTASRRRIKKVGFNSPVSHIEVQSDGKILVGGNFTLYNGDLCGNGLTRLLPSGALDGSFTNNLLGLFYHAYFSSILIQADGKIVIGGTFKTETGATAPTKGVARLMPDGKLDRSFPAGSSSNVDGIVECMLKQPDNKIIVGGIFQQFHGVKVNGLVRLMPDGRVDSTFVKGLGTAVGPEGTVQSLALHPNGTIVVAGTFKKFNGYTVEGLVQIKPNGTPDYDFIPEIGRRFFHGYAPLTPEEEKTDPGPHLPAMILELDGRLLLAGEFVAYDEDQNVIASRLIRIYPDGRVDLDFVNNLSLYGFHSEVDSLFLQADGRILVGSDNPFSRINPDGTHDTVFLRTVGTSLNGPIYTLTQDTQGRIWAGGDFTAAVGPTIKNIVRLNPDGTYDETFLELTPP